MSRDLPLNAIRVFAAVGRLLSLKKAGDELGVTPSAVSHQISSLESFLGLRLLRREGNHVALTMEGKNYLRQVAGNLDQLSRATKWLQSTKGQTLLRVAAPPSLAALWLMPRVATFGRMRPDLALSVVSIPVLLMGRQMDRFDVVIRLYPEPPAALNCELLSPAELMPVCSPALLGGREPLREPADLGRYTLLESDDDLYHHETGPGWIDWLQTAKLPDVRSQRYMNFSPPHLLHQALVDGLGVGLAFGLVAADAIGRGELTCPFGPTLPYKGNYYMVCEPSIAGRSDIVAFRRYLRDEAEKSRQHLHKAPPRLAVAS
jgi:LysR family transcriptional regulator, glycine cleavage system transcriptional activator